MYFTWITGVETIKTAD